MLKHILSKWPALVLLLGILFFLGWLRDYFFLNMNDQLYKLYFSGYEFRLPSPLRWMERFPYKELYYLKYFITILFSVLYFLLTWIGLRVFFPYRKKLLKEITVVYAVLGLIAAIPMAFALWGDSFRAAYGFSRMVIGIMHSPLIFMLAFPAMFLQSESNENKD